MVMESVNDPKGVVLNGKHFISDQENTGFNIK